MSTLLRSRQEKPFIGVTCKVSNDFSEDILTDRLTLTVTLNHKKIDPLYKYYNRRSVLFISSDRA